MWTLILYFESVSVHCLFISLIWDHLTFIEHPVNEKKDTEHLNEVIKTKRRANQQSTECKDGGEIKSIPCLMILSKTKDCVNYEATQFHNNNTNNNIAYNLFMQNHDKNFSRISFIGWECRNMSNLFSFGVGRFSLSHTYLMLWLLMTPWFAYSFGVSV